MSGLWRAERFLIAFSAVASLTVLFTIIPLVSLFAKFDPRIASEIFSSPTMARQVRDAFITSLAASAVAVALLTVLGVPLAYLLARYQFKGKSLVEAIVDLPLVIPHAVAGIMILTAYSRRGLLGWLASEVGVRVQDSFTGIVLVMMFVSLPLMVDTVKAGIVSVDPMLETVARTLGASGFRAFIDVVLPMTWNHILAGVILAWARALSEVGALLIVAYYPTTVNVLIIEYMHVYGLPYAVVVSALFAALAVALFASLRVVVGR